MHRRSFCCDSCEAYEKFIGEWVWDRCDGSEGDWFWVPMEANMVILIPVSYILTIVTVVSERDMNEKNKCKHFH